METAVGDAYVSYTDELFVTKSVTATFTASADGVFSNASGSFVLRLNDLTIGGPQVIDFDAGYAALYDSVPSRTYTQQVDLQAGHTYLLYNAFEALASGTTNYAQHRLSIERRHEQYGPSHHRRAGGQLHDAQRT